jgi:hypothetical protein
MRRLSSFQEVSVYYYDKRNKKLYGSRQELAVAHHGLLTATSQVEANSYMFLNDIEELKLITPENVDYTLYVLVPGPINVEDNTLTLVPQLRPDLTVDGYRKMLWTTAYNQLDAFYKKYTDETPPVEQASWVTQLTEAKVVEGYFDAPEALPANSAPTLELMLIRRQVEGETVFDLARLVLNAAARYMTLSADLVGQWQHIDRKLREATTLEALQAVNITIEDPATHITA